ncbi:MAG: hypothetical protein WAV38_04745 [Xanthobacteraceae bacterium]
MTSRQQADARKRIRRACAGLVAAGLILKVGVGWTLPPETPQEARVRSNPTAAVASVRGPERADQPGDPIKVPGQLGSDNANVVAVAAG